MTLSPESTSRMTLRSGGGLDRNLTQHLALRVDYPPLARDFAGFGRKGFHTGGKGTKTTGRATECQISA